MPSTNGTYRTSIHNQLPKRLFCTYSQAATSSPDTQVDTCCSVVLSIHRSKRITHRPLQLDFATTIFSVSSVSTVENPNGIAIVFIERFFIERSSICTGKVVPPLNSEGPREVCFTLAYHS